MKYRSFSLFFSLPRARRPLWTHGVGLPRITPIYALLVSHTCCFASAHTVGLFYGIQSGSDVLAVTFLVEHLQKLFVELTPHFAVAASTYRAATKLHPQLRISKGRRISDRAPTPSRMPLQTNVTTPLVACVPVAEWLSDSAKTENRPSSSSLPPVVSVSLQALAFSPSSLAL